MIAERLLHILEDVSGVMGSFVIAPRGRLLVHSMPANFAPRDLEITAGRIVRVIQCGAQNGIEAQDGIFDFGEGKLLIREFVRGYLCVLCTAAVNMRSLRLAARLVARGLPAEL